MHHRLPGLTQICEHQESGIKTPSSLGCGGRNEKFYAYAIQVQSDAVREPFSGFDLIQCVQLLPPPFFLRELCELRAKYSSSLRLCVNLLRLLYFLPPRTL
jgi:hypothetical protein